jgi:hypothetical protein
MKDTRNRPDRGGEPTRRPQRSGDPSVEKNPPRNRDGQTAEDAKPSKRPDERKSGTRRQQFGRSD